MIKSILKGEKTLKLDFYLISSYILKINTYPGAFSDLKIGSGGREIYAIDSVIHHLIFYLRKNLLSM